MAVQEVAKIQLPVLSRYRLTDWYYDVEVLETDNGRATKTRDVLRTSVCTFPQIAVTDFDIRYKVESGDLRRLDKLAYKFYGNPLLWWVIAWANNISDPIFGFEVNQELVIPAYSAVLEAFKT